MDSSADDDYLESLTDSLATCLDSLPSSNELDAKFRALEDKISGDKERKEGLDLVEKRLQAEMEAFTKSAKQEIVLLRGQVNDVTREMREELAKLKQDIPRLQHMETPESR